MKTMSSGKAASAAAVRTEIDGVPIDRLVRRFGSPLFVYSEATVRRTYRETFGAFAARYPNVAFGWSYKTNYLQAICALMHQEGALAEIVSAMEYDKARALNVPGERILFNGPHKPRPILERAVAEGATIHVDHFHEIDDLEQIATDRRRRLKIGLRLNLDAGLTPRWSRFGFHLESGQALEAVQRIAARKRLRLTALHCHLGTFILDPQAYARAVTKMVAFAYTVEKAFGFAIESLDLGGGLPSRIRPKGASLPPDFVVPRVDAYAEAITQALSRALRPGDAPRLLLECGRALIDPAGSLITTVVAAKRLADGTRAYVLDAGVNLLFTSFWSRFDIALDRPLAGPDETSVLYGPLCMAIDAIDDGVPLPPLERGQRLVISPVGAYNNTQWVQFIEYRPNVVLVGPRGRVDLIREAEDLTDLVRRERLPRRLRPPQGRGATVGATVSH